jgi:hypothetical protein
MLKHVGKMKNNGAKIVVAYRTLPGDHTHALVVGTGNLGDNFHDDLMQVVQSPEGQQSFELAQILSVRKFRDGANMLQWLHSRGHLKKVPTDGVIMTPTTQSSLALNELNELIAQEKGITVQDLALLGTENAPTDSTQTAKATEPTTVVAEQKEMTPAEMRSKADALFKEAQALRKKADAVDPPKKKTKSVVVDSE